MIRIISAAGLAAALFVSPLLLTVSSEARGRKPVVAGEVVTPRAKAQRASRGKMVRAKSQSSDGGRSCGTYKYRDAAGKCVDARDKAPKKS